MIINLNKNDIESVKYAANEVIKVIKDGGIVISPTDTVYGMLANAFLVFIVFFSFSNMVF